MHRKLTEPINTVQTQPTARVESVSNTTQNIMQEADRPEKCYTKVGCNLKCDNNDKPMVVNHENSKINSFLSGPNQENDETKY